VIEEISMNDVPSWSPGSEDIKGVILSGQRSLDCKHKDSVDALDRKKRFEIDINRHFAGKDKVVGYF
ncbi:MAG: hypothetical protein D6816_05825, partial [Bacteroidetes bacterium]